MKRIHLGMKCLCLLVLGLGLLAARTAAAQTILLKLGTIKGDVQLSGYADFINVTSFSFGHSVGVSAPAGPGGNREASLPSFSEITITKPMDSSSVLLANKCSLGDVIGDGHFVVLKSTGGGGLTPFYEVGFKNAIISGYNVTGTSGDMPMESFSINFTAISWTYSSIAPDGQSTNAITKSFDLAAQVAGDDKIQ